jgi:hypothetical protein
MNNNTFSTNSNALAVYEEANATPEYVASTVGPASIPLKQADNNNQTRALMGMPFKPNTMAQGNMFSMFRKAYIKKSGGGEGFFDASQYINLKKINATGKSSTNAVGPNAVGTNAVGTNDNYNALNTNKYNVMSFSGPDQTSVRDGKTRCRAGGCVAPKKKGAYYY